MLAGCTRKSTHWQEEVKLSTGEMIVVERETNFIPRGALYNLPGDTRWHADSTEIAFRYSKIQTGKIEWKSERKDFQSIPNPEKPLLLDLTKDGEPVIMTSLYDKSLKGGRVVCIAYYRYQYRNGHWENVPLPDTFPKREANLFQHYFDQTRQGRLDLNTKKKLIKEKPPLAWYRNIGPERSKCWHRGVNVPW